MKYSEFFSSFRNFWPTPPPPQLYMLATTLPPPLPRPGRQHFQEIFFSCPFHSKSAPRKRGRPPQLFDASYAPVHGVLKRTTNKQRLMGPRPSDGESRFVCGVLLIKHKHSSRFFQKKYWRGGGE